MRELIRDLLPPVVARAWRAAAGRAFGFRGDHASWAEARAASAGYDASQVLAKTLEAALQVQRGEAAMDRDGMAFAQADYPYAVLAGLLRAAGNEGLTVLDVGGSLGNIYRQFRGFSARPAALRWRVLEQPAVAAAGRAHFESEELRFFAALPEALAGGAPDVVLLSSALQYFEAPYALLDEVGRIPGARLILDRTPCAERERDVLCVQSIPAEIYDASYPCWIFSRAKLETALDQRHARVASFRDPAGPLRSDRGAFELRGYLLDPRT